MDKEAVVSRYKKLLEELDTPANEVILTAGAALVVLELRKSVKSLDIDIPVNIFNWIGTKHEIIIKEGSVPRIKYSEDVTLRILEDTIGLSNNGGVWMYSLGELITQKRYLSTMKDRDEDKRSNDQMEVWLLLSQRSLKMMTT